MTVHNLSVLSVCVSRTWDRVSMADVVRGWEGTCCYSSLSHSLSLPPLNRAENNTREREGERGGNRVCVDAESK